MLSRTTPFPTGDDIGNFENFPIFWGISPLGILSMLDNDTYFFVGDFKLLWAKKGRSTISITILDDEKNEICKFNILYEFIAGYDAAFINKSPILFTACKRDEDNTEYHEDFLDLIKQKGGVFLTFTDEMISSFNAAKQEALQFKKESINYVTLLNNLEQQKEMKIRQYLKPPSLSAEEIEIVELALEDRRSSEIIREIMESRSVIERTVKTQITIVLNLLGLNTIDKIKELQEIILSVSIDDVLSSNLLYTPVEIIDAKVSDFLNDPNNTKPPTEDVRLAERLSNRRRDK